MVKLETHVSLNLDPVVRLQARIKREIAGQGTEFHGCLKRWALRYRTYIRRRFDRFSKGGGNWPPLALVTIQARNRRLGKKTVVLPEAKAKKPKRARKSILSKLKSALKDKKKRGKKLLNLGKDLFKSARKHTKKAKNALKGKSKKPPKPNFTIARDTKNPVKGQTVKVKGKYSILRDTGTLFAALDPVFSGKPGAFEQMLKGSVVVGFGGPAAYEKTSGKRVTVADIAAFHQTGGGKLPKRTILVMPDDAVYEGMREDLRRTVMRIIKRDD